MNTPLFSRLMERFNTAQILEKLDENKGGVMMLLHKHDPGCPALKNQGRGCNCDVELELRDI